MGVSSLESRQYRCYRTRPGTAHGLAFQHLSPRKLYSWDMLSSGHLAEHSRWPVHVSSISYPLPLPPCRCRAASAMTVHALKTSVEKVSVWPVPCSHHIALNFSSSQESDQDLLFLSLGLLCSYVF